MPDFDRLAFDVNFALRRKITDRKLRATLRGLGDDATHRIAKDVADHLRQSNWISGAPSALARADQFPRVKRD